MSRTTFWVVLILVAIVLGAAVHEFNTLTKIDERRQAAWTPLENVLKARYDLVPKLVTEIILYTGTEDPETKKLADNRKKFLGADDFPELVATADQLERSITDVFIQIKNRYPGIANSYQFVALNDGFQKSAEEMKPAVNAYNLVVDEYNTNVREFPKDIIAKLLGFEMKAPYFRRE